MEVPRDKSMGCLFAVRNWTCLWIFKNHSDSDMTATEVRMKCLDCIHRGLLLEHLVKEAPVDQKTSAMLKSTAHYPKSPNGGGLVGGDAHASSLGRKAIAR